MEYSVIVKEEAQLEAIEAYLYYEEQQEGLGERFLLSLQRRYTSLSRHPEYYSYITLKQTKNTLRDVALEGLPYVVIFEIIGMEVIVYSIHLTHKRRKITYKE